MAVVSQPDLHQSERRAGRTLPRWVFPATVGAVGLAGCVLLRLVDPSAANDPYPACPFRVLTGGVDCPGCGGLRATHALTTGHLGVAADHNLLFVLLIPSLVATYAVWLARSVHPRALSRLRLPRWWLPALVAAIVGFWALRLLPGPFEWLASGRA